MKTLRTLFLATAMLGLAACSDDDNNSNGSNNNNNNQSIAGTYNLTSALVPDAVDFNQDGSSSDDLLDESECYLDTHMILNADGTFTAVTYRVLIEPEISCYSEESSGTWVADGQDIILTNTLIEPALVTEYVWFDNMLTLTQPNNTYPDRDEAGSPIYSTGAITYTYTKVN